MGFSSYSSQRLSNSENIADDHDLPCYDKNKQIWSLQLIEVRMRPSEVFKHRDAVLEITAQYGVQNVRVFGSALHGDDTEGSDLDLLVDVPKGTTLLDMVRLQKAIEGELGVPVDVLTALDLPEKFRAKMLQEARPLSLANPTL